jgi:signal transduction histidine kinase
MTLKIINISFILVFSVFNFSWGQLNEQTIDSLRKSFYTYADNGDGKKALEINEQLSAYYLEIGDSSEWVRTQVHKAEILRANMDLNSAINVLKNADEINKKLEPATVKSTFYNRKAAILFELGKNEEALLAIKESQKIDSLKSFKWRILSNLTLEAAAHRNLGNLKKAERSLKKIIKLVHVYQEKAERSLKKVIGTAEIKEELEEYLLALYNLAYVYQEENEFEKAIITSNRYQKADTSKTDISKYADMLHLNAMCYRKLKIYDSAYVFLDMAHAIRLKEMESLIENNAQATKQAADLAQEKERSKRLVLENKAAGQQVVILVLAIAMLLIVAFVINRRRKYYKVLKDKQDKLNRELQVSGDFKTKLMGILAHDVRNPMNGIIGMLELFNHNEITQDVLKEHMQTLQSNAQSVNFLIDDMLNWVKTQGNAFTIKKSNVQVAQCYNTLIQELNILLKSKNIEINHKGISNEAVMYTDSSVLKLIIRNILTNAIKYSKVGGTIDIEYFKDQNHTIKITDHGVGMDGKTLAKVLSKSGISKLGTQNEKGTGLGLSLIYELTKELNGTVAIESTLNVGTTVTLHLP